MTITTSALTPAGSTRRWRRIRAFVLDRDDHRCKVPDDGTGQVCDQHATHVDHIVRRADGGTDHPSNLRAACAPCNLRRSAPGRARRKTPRGGWSW